MRRKAATAGKNSCVPAVTLGEMRPKALLSGDESYALPDSRLSSGQCRPKSADAGPRMASMQVVLSVCVRAYAVHAFSSWVFFQSLVLVVVGYALRDLGVMRGMILGAGIEPHFPVATTQPHARLMLEPDLLGPSCRGRADGIGGARPS